MHIVHPTYAAARMADYDRMAVEADRVRQAIHPDPVVKDPSPGAFTRLMMTLGFRAPATTHAGA